MIPKSERGPRGAESALRGQGLRLTRPRRVVLEVVRGTDVHPTSPAEIQPVFDRFLGLDLGAHVWMQVGRDHAVTGEFEAGHSDEDKGKLSAVHFVRFRFPDTAVRALEREEA